MKAHRPLVRRLSHRRQGFDVSDRLLIAREATVGVDTADQADLIRIRVDAPALRPNGVLGGVLRYFRGRRGAFALLGMPQVPQDPGGVLQASRFDIEPDAEVEVDLTDPDAGI